MDHIHPDFTNLVQREQKEKFLNQKAKVFWLTGLSGSGKSTIASSLEQRLFSAGYLFKVLDGDNIRSGINNNLGFTLEDREENIRRIAEVSKLFIQCGIPCINAFVSPTIAIRKKAKKIIGDGDFFEVYIKSSLEVCEQRDVKGLYAKARSGQIKGFTGIDSPYEEPEDPALIINTNELSIEESVDALTDFITEKIVENGNL